MWRRCDVGGTSPPPRNCVAATSWNNKFFVFGGIGQSEKEKFNELYAFDFDDSEPKWVKLETHGDVPTARYCTTINSTEDKLVLFGGFDGDRLNTVHFLNLKTLEWKFVVTNGEIPEKRSHHTASLIGNRLIVFGGLSQEGRRLNDLHVLDLKTMCWSQPIISGQPPSPRLGHVSALLQYNRTVLAIFGGYGGPDGHTKYNDLTLLHFDTMTWSRPIVTGTTPPGMYAHQAAAVRDKLIIFGGDFGVHHRNLSNDIYIFELANMKWSKIKQTGELPPSRSHFASAIGGNYFIIFGGSGKGEREKLNDVYSLDLEAVDILKEVSFEETKTQVNETIEHVTKEIGRLLKELTQESRDSASSSSDTPNGTSKSRPTSPGRGGAHPEREKNSSLKYYKDTCAQIKMRLQATMSKMRLQFEKLVEEKEDFERWREEQAAVLENERDQFEQQKKVVAQIIQGQSGRVRVNVGGHYYDTSLATLTKDSQSMLSAMFSGRYGLIQDADGSYFIDRDGTHFRYILNYLRDNTVILPPNYLLHMELLKEADYFQLDGLAEIIKQNLKRLDPDTDKDARWMDKRQQKYYYSSQRPSMTLPPSVNMSSVSNNTNTSPNGGNANNVNRSDDNNNSN